MFIRGHLLYITSFQVDNTKLLRVILQGLYAEYKMGMTKSETLSTSKKLSAIRQNSNQVAKNAEFVDVRVIVAARCLKVPISNS